MTGVQTCALPIYYQMVDFLADAPVCLQMKRLLELWHHYFKTPIIQVDFPLKFYADEAMSRYQTGLQKFVAELEEISGQPLDQKRLELEIERSNQLHELFQYFYELLKADQPIIQWRDLNAAVQASFLLDKKETISILRDWKKAVQDNPTPANYRGRILISGGMLAFQDNKLKEVMAELGSDFIMDELCIGSRGVCLTIREATLEGLADAYLHNVPCGSLPYPDQATDPRLRHLKHLIEEYRVNGVIYYTLRFCDGYSFKVKELKKFLSGYNIPVLHVHSDYSPSDLGQLRTRVEALLESLRQ